VSAEVVVRTVRVRLPAASAAEGEAFARATLEATAASLPAGGRTRHIGGVSVTVRGEPVPETAANRLVESLR
jgi:hypothetical protein